MRKIVFDVIQHVHPYKAPQTGSESVTVYVRVGNEVTPIEITATSINNRWGKNLARVEGKTIFEGAPRRCVAEYPIEEEAIIPGSLTIYINP